MDMTLVQESLKGLQPFLIYVGLSVGLLVLFSGIYMVTTTHDEMRLIRQNNAAAAIAFVGAFVGYALTIAAVSHAARSLLEYVLWAVIGMIVQLVIYWIFRLVLMRDVSRRIEAGEGATGIMLGGLSLAGGIINAAAMAV